MAYGLFAFKDVEELTFEILFILLAVTLLPSGFRVFWVPV